ncbi:hypothetical protein CI610_00269 [invertebrate metagenome]|uniref:Uncharacterized protein n=1 Tax=invertebrate metagenome TaxID=1711999 RepID=A0A2H9TC01_9ZZZZ
MACGAAMDKYFFPYPFTERTGYNIRQLINTSPIIKSGELLEFEKSGTQTKDAELL